MFPTDEIFKQLRYRTSRSSGSGGQNVNKVETKVDAILDFQSSDSFSDEQKASIQLKCANRINANGELVVSSSESRSQLQNKEFAVERMLEILQTALKPIKKRRPTTVTKAADKKRLESKKEHSEKKKRRNFKH